MQGYWSGKSGYATVGMVSADEGSRRICHIRGRTTDVVASELILH